jgi:inosose dehydratase
LGSRGLRLSGGAVFAGLHRGSDALKQAVTDCRQEAELLTALGAEHLILLPEGFTDLDGNLTQPQELDADQWGDLTSGMSELASLLRDEYGLRLDFHSHADSHVGTQAEIVRFLEDTDPDVVQLCLDTGHVAYYRGDNLAIVRAFPDRIGYVHLKQVDPAIVQQVEDEGLGFAEAVRRGVMIEPPHGLPDMPPLLAELDSLGVPLFGIVEQDLFPCETDVPFPIAERTRQYFNACGVGPAPA